MDLHNWLLFLSITVIATITPGPAVLLVTSHSVAYGWRYAFFTILGNITGLFLMSALSVAGLSAVILSSVTVFTAVKLIGALYLVYLGIRIWRYGFVGATRIREAQHGSKNKNTLYLQGLFVALSNPKAIAFSTALFPQFIDHQSDLTVQFGILVFTVMVLSAVCLIAYAIVAERTTSRVVTTVPAYLNKLFGAVFIGFGLMLANTTHKAV